MQSVVLTTNGVKTRYELVEFTFEKRGEGFL